jgi:hypothetical protein
MNVKWFHSGEGCSLDFISDSQIKLVKMKVFFIRQFLDHQKRPSDLSTWRTHTSLTEKVDWKNRQNQKLCFYLSFHYCFNSSFDYCFDSSFDDCFDSSFDYYFDPSFDDYSILRLIIAFIYHFWNHVWWLAAENALELIVHKFDTEKYMLTMFWSIIGPVSVHWLRNGYQRMHRLIAHISPRLFSQT